MLYLPPRCPHMDLLPLLCLLPGLLSANILDNGDFESGEVARDSFLGIF